ncbi:alpha/beta hydrolase [Mesonia aestuariivivens]|uniref:Alpha/beta hydrolase n=1 Tax=Mesonia aestuariivivens TaxID=2796128 RepID=A0ABS6VYS4_9FLAO|nr:alpha/beta hydrolase [Mesonia aestuariivivens]MBW2960740.1 alpha/beta hydrolase [Mesonia aestuariivivens]
MNLKTIGILLTLLSFNMYGQDSTFKIWENVPNAIKVNYDEEVTYENGKVWSTSKVTAPTLTAFIAKGNSSKTAILICPGGGYTHLAMEKEGFKVAEWLNTLGIHAFVLKYRMPSSASMENPAVGPLQDAQKALRLIKSKNFDVEIDQVGVMGFSAGGHLASTLATHYNQQIYKEKSNYSAKPDFSVLIYPVISMEKGITHQGSKTNLLGVNAPQNTVDYYSNEKQVDENTPISFLVHATNDTSVPVENSINYYLQLKKYGVSAEMHLYEDGGHGFGLGKEGTNTNWPKALHNWLKVNHYIQK